VSAGDARSVEQLMGEWESLRVTEAYRRTRFMAQRDDVVARWNARGPHGETQSEFVSFRLTRGDMALREILELEVRSDAAFEECRDRLRTLESLDPKESRRTLSSVRETCLDAVRVDMRYRHTLVTTLLHEVRELTSYIEERLAEAG